MAISPTCVKAQVVEGVPHHKMYGFFQNNDELPQGSYGFSSMWTNAFHIEDEYNPVGAKLLYPYGGYLGSTQLSGVMSIFGGAAIDGIYYAPQYEYNITTGVSPASFISFNLYTGERVELGNWVESDVTTKRVIDLTYDVKNKKLYACSFNLGKAYLEEVNPNTGQFTQIAQINTALGTLAADINGNLYGIGQDGWLYKINSANGNCTQVYNTKLSGMPSGQTMEFDKTNGDLYWCSNTYGYRNNPDYPDDSYSRSYMVRFQFNADGTVKSMDNLGEIGDKSVMHAMYIPYVAAGDNAPAAPSNVSYDVASDGTHNVSIKWTNPTETFGGAPLTDLSCITITRDDEIIKVLNDAEIGKEMSYTDNGADKNKQYKYAIYATNSVGDGERALQYQYVGLDAPGEPENLFINVGDGSQSAVISWTAPQYGAHGNKLDQSSVRYDVVRQPDGYTVASDIAECSAADNTLSRRLGKYYYVVTAKNEVGKSSAQTVTWVLGKAFQVDADNQWEEDFSDDSLFNAWWVGVDNNGDAYSWMINSTAVKQIINDGYEYGAVYLLNPGFTPSDIKGADEWLLAPPVQISDDDDYVVEVSARSISDENLSITCGNRNLIKDQKTLADLTVKKRESEGSLPFNKYVIGLPKGAGYKCIGLHLTTPASEDVQTRNSLIQINDVVIRHKVPGEETGIVSIKNDANGIEEYYSINGIRLNALQKGLNIVKTKDGKMIKRIVK